jgi:4-hydroxy-tetrahydrodipicolinate synthase
MLDGVTVPVVTTMNADREPDAGGMDRLLRELADAGVVKLLLFGSNGEGPVLSTEQLGPFAEEVSARWRELVSEGIVIVNVSGMSTDEGVRRARAVLSARPDAIALCPPMYFRHSRQDVVEHYRVFASLGPPVVAYNIPAYTGNDLDLEVTRDLLELDHVVGMKDSSKVEGRIRGLAELASSRPDFGISQGDEGALVRGLADGACGITPGIANLAPALTLELFAAARSGNAPLADELQDAVQALVKLHAIRPGIATTKAALHMRGVIDGVVSRPFTDYSPQDRDALAAFLAPWDEHLIGGF